MDSEREKEIEKKERKQSAAIYSFSVSFIFVIQFYNFSRQNFFSCQRNNLVIKNMLNCFIRFALNVSLHVRYKNQLSIKYIRQCLLIGSQLAGPDPLNIFGVNILNILVSYPILHQLKK